MKADRLLLLLLTFSVLFPLSIKPLLAGEFDPLSTTEFNRALNLVVPANTLASTRTVASSPAATSPANAVPATETLLVERHINQKGQSGRLADVYTYDYVQNETVFSVVDLTTNKVLSTERKQKLQLPLTANELKRATDLVFIDSEERRLLNNEYKRITGNELKSVSQLNVKAFVFDASSLPERLNPASKACGLHRCAQVLLYTHASVVFEVSPIVNLFKGVVTQNIGF
jgi:Cu2+-containing amine oxidase